MDSFRTFNRIKIPDVISYIQEWMTINTNGYIVVGTDSKELKNAIIYATVIGLYYAGNHGAHLLYRRIRRVGKTSLFHRLWQEVQDTHEILHLLKESLNITGVAHIDINENEEHASNIAYQSSVGFFKSMGYDVISKPNAWISSCAADLIVNGVSQKNSK